MTHSAESDSSGSREPIRSSGWAFAFDRDGEDRSPPPRIGRYRVLEELGRGGMGIVYLAEHPNLRKRVAVKVMRPLADIAGARRRFEREFHLMAAFDHPNIVAIHDADYETGRDGAVHPFFVMEHIRGASPITTHANARGLNLHQRIEHMLRICDAVEYIHRRGVLHLDIKPGNILVGANGQPKLTDFGLSRLMVEQAERSRAGTRAYMSPEQQRGDPDDLDQRSDVYSLGCVLRELLGRPPAHTWEQTAEEDPAATPAPPGDVNSECGFEIGRIIARATEHDRERRYETAGALSDALRDAISPPRPIGVAAAIRANLKRFIADRPRIALGALCVFVAALSMIATEFIGQPLLFKWTGASAWYWSRPIFNATGAAEVAPALNEITIVALRDSTDVASLAAGLGLEGVNPRQLTSLRRLHGALNRALADAAPTVVIWDIIFRTQTEFDEDFASSVEVLRDAGATVVIAAPSVLLNERGLPSLSDTILRAGVEWGSITLLRGDRPGVHVPLAVQQRGQPPMPALSLAGLAGHRRPGARFDISLDVSADQVRIECWRPDPLRPGARRSAGPPISLAAASIGSNPPDGRWRAIAGLHDGDIFAHSVVSTLPDDEAFEGRTISYEDVMVADHAQLRRWFSGKAVMIGDFRSAAGDIHTVDGRTMPGAWLQAAALATLIAEAGPRAVGVMTAGAVWAGAGLSGVVIGLLSISAARSFGDRRNRTRVRPPTHQRPGGVRAAAALWLKSGLIRWPAAALLIATILALIAAAHHQGGRLLEPLPPAFCALLAAELIVIVRLWPVRQTHRRPMSGRLHALTETSNVETV